MQYCEIEKLVEILQSIQDNPINDIHTSLSILEFFESMLPYEKRRLLLVNKLIEQYGTPDEKGNFEVKPNNSKFFEFLSKYNELQTISVGIEIPEKLSIESFNGFPLTMNQLKILRQIFNYNSKG